MTQVRMFLREDMWIDPSWQVREVYHSPLVNRVWTELDTLWHAGILELNYLRDGLIPWKDL